MYERLTDRARVVMQAANQEAIRFKHEYLGSEHILLGLLKEGSGVAVQVLKNLTLDPQRIIAEIERLVVEGVGTVSMRARPQTPAIKRVLGYAITEALNLEQDYVGTEHILLGLLREEGCVAGALLRGFGLRAEQLRTEIKNVLQQPHDWGRMPALSQFPAQAGKDVVELPTACPKCGKPVVRVIWGWVHLFGRNLEDVTAGRAILGSPVDAGGPPWVCLNCSPKWSEVHHLALQEHDLQIVKENAIVKADFEKAAQCRDMQTAVRRQMVILLDELLRKQ